MRLHGNRDEPEFDYVETWEPPPGQGYTRYAGATLVRDPKDRGYWRRHGTGEQDELRWVVDDFGYLKGVRVDLAAQQLQCRHCWSPLNHYDGRLWHEVGALVFPQYCRWTYPGDSQLHEPQEC